MTELSQLKWQCRRGVKELDLVLGIYLQQHYANANDNEQRAFKNLLQLEDPILFDLLLESSNAQEKDHAELIEKLRGLL